MRRAVAWSSTTYPQNPSPGRKLDLLWFAFLPGGLLFAYLQIRGYWTAGNLGLDSHAYWVAARDHQSWYTRPAGYRDAYLYSPVLAQLLTPLGQLPWPVFGLLWAALTASALAWLLAPLGVMRGSIAALYLIPDLLVGNLFTFFAVVLVLTVRGHASALALPVLTKIGPGVVGLWLVVRREWRQVAWAAGTTLAVLLASFLLDPAGWGRWFEFLHETASDRGVSASVRLATAVVVVLLAARRRWAWLLAPAMVLAGPNLEGFPALAVLAAIPRLLRWQRHAGPTPERTDEVASTRAA